MMSTTSPLELLGRRVFKELQVALINGVFLGTVLFIAVIAWKGDLGLAVLLLSALLLVIVVAALVGASVPLAFHKGKVDPAIATGPLITVLNDIIGLVIYLSLAEVYLTRFL